MTNTASQDEKEKSVLKKKLAQQQEELSFLASMKGAMNEVIEEEERKNEDADAMLETELAQLNS